VLVATFTLAALITMAAPVIADDVSSFFTGKTVRIIV
jgi:hypothetical protein